MPGPRSLTLRRKCREKMHQVFTMDIGGKVFTAETGKFAKQASGSVLCRYGETVVLVTATMAKQAREGIDFFPLLVDYEERMYAAGKIPGGFIKREGRPSEAAILAGRMIDRPIRPLFPDGFRNDVQIVATVLSVEPGVEPSLVAMNGASIALSVSPTPFQGPIGGVKVGRVDGKFVINPGIEEQNASDMSVVVAGTRDAILMVEAGANEVSEADMLDAILFGHEQIKKIIAFQDEIVAAAGTGKLEFKNFEPASEKAAEVRAFGEQMLIDAVKNPDKLSRDAKIEEAKASIKAHFIEEYAEESAPEEISYMVDSLEKSVVRMMITKEHIRPDGRAPILRSRPPAQGARLRALPEGTDPGADELHARFRKRGAGARRTRTRRVQELYAPVQLPALLGRRSQAHKRARKARGRTRGACRKGARACHTQAGGVPLHDKDGLRGH